MLQREKLLYSERAWAYRIKMDALDHRGAKGDQHSYKVMETQTGEKKNQLFRIIRLTELIPTLLDKVDEHQLAFNPAVELSYLSRQEQAILAEAMTKYETKPSLSQAVRLKKLNKEGKLTSELIDTILSETKKPPKNEPASTMRFRKYFPPDYSQKQIDNVIIELLKDWKARAIVIQ